MSAGVKIKMHWVTKQFLMQDPVDYQRHRYPKRDGNDDADQHPHKKPVWLGCFYFSHPILFDAPT
jgi:hypothetical protein